VTNSWELVLLVVGVVGRVLGPCLLWHLLMWEHMVAEWPLVQAYRGCSSPVWWRERWRWRHLLCTMGPHMHQWLWVLWVWLVPGRAVIIMMVGAGRLVIATGRLVMGIGRLVVGAPESSCTRCRWQRLLVVGMLGAVGWASIIGSSWRVQLLVRMLMGICRLVICESRLVTSGKRSSCRQQRLLGVRRRVVPGCRL
jgi:hypothetical protein